MSQHVELQHMYKYEQPVNRQCSLKLPPRRKEDGSGQRDKIITIANIFPSTAETGISKILVLRW